MKDINTLYNDTNLYASEKYSIYDFKSGSYFLNEQILEDFKKYIGLGNDKIITNCKKCNCVFPFKYEITGVLNLYKRIDVTQEIYLTNSVDGKIGTHINLSNGSIINKMISVPSYSMTKKNYILIYYMNCTNCGTNYTMYTNLEIDNGLIKITKIGQYPSMLDVHGFDFSKYKKQLEKIDAYSDYKKADLSYIDHFYVGAFAYLRRIFEKMVRNYLKKGDITLPDNHMDTKISSIKQYFDPRIQNTLKKLYGILSVSIHELDEDESKEYYRYLKAIIDIQLEYELTEDEKAKQSKELNDVLSQIEKGIKAKVNIE